MKIAVLHRASAFADAQLEHLRARLSDHVLVAWDPSTPAPERDFEVVLGAGTIDRELLQSLPLLALVQTTSAGYEDVDLDAARDMGIWVSNAPSGETGNATSVAEWAVLLMLAASRDLGLALRSEASGDAPPARVALALSGKAVCIVGLGGIGRLLLERLRPFGVHLIVVDEAPEHAPADAEAYAASDLKLAITSADYVVLCVPATLQNDGMIDATVIAAMKRGAVLINVARGALVDEAALREALESGHLRAAGLDVVRHEPASSADPLVREAYAFVTPHIAGPTDLTIEGTARYIGTVLERFAQGRRWPSLLNEPPQPRHLLPHDAPE